jgi:hypothetical protein
LKRGRFCKSAWGLCGGQKWRENSEDFKAITLLPLSTLLHTLHKAKKHFPCIFQWFTALHRYTGGVVVAGSNPAVPNTLFSLYKSTAYMGLAG